MSPKHPHFHIRELRLIIGYIIVDEDFRKLENHRQHIFFNRYEHLLNAAFFAYQLARFFRADIQVCTLAGLLHDYHFTTLKSYSHAVIAAKNAVRFWVDEEVIEIVRSHMYPLGRSKIKRAHGRNFWVVKLADFSAAFFEISYSILFLQFQHDRMKLKRTHLLMEIVGEE